MLEVIDLTCERGDRWLFAGLGFTVRPGMLLQIDGDNGAGKTSLLRMLCGLIEPTRGEIRWNGQAIAGLKDEYGRTVAYLGHANAIKDDLTALENLRSACAMRGLAATDESMRAMLATVGLARFEDVPARALSRGQQRRVGLARLLMNTAAPLWILDEPFAALDRAGIDAICRQLERELAGGRAVIFTTHQEVPLRAPQFARITLGSPAA